MQEIRTEVIINRSPEIVWDILINTTRYAHWNPLIYTLLGEIKSGQKVQLVQVLGGKKVSAAPMITKATFPEFSWKATMGIKIIAQAEHYFRVERLTENKTRFLHGERFSGFLSPLIPKLFSTLQDDFNRMNEALKNEVENTSANPILCN